MEPVRIVTRTTENRTEPEPRTQNRFVTEAIDKRERGNGTFADDLNSDRVDSIGSIVVGADCEIRWIDCSIEQMSGKLSARESGKAKHNFPGSERGIWNFTLWPINDNNERETLNRSRTNRLYSGCEKHADLVPRNPINNATNPRNSHPKMGKMCQYKQKRSTQNWANLGSLFGSVWETTCGTLPVCAQLRMSCGGLSSTCG